jgi:hypothetical protein
MAKKQKPTGPVPIESIKHKDVRTNIPTQELRGFVAVEEARPQWVPAVNNHGGFGRWAFVEVTDPWDAKNTIRAEVAEGLPQAVP